MKALVIMRLNNFFCTFATLIKLNREKNSDEKQ